jgi:hypothetical protein
VLGYHGCDLRTAEKLLRNEPFQPSENEYDWLGSGIYFWEANPDRAMDWARHTVAEKNRRTGGSDHPAVIGAAVNLGFCLDLITSNGIQAVELACQRYRRFITASGAAMPRNTGGDDHLGRYLDRAVINFLHETRSDAEEPPFDTVRGVFMEGEHIYENSGFRRKTHIQICVRNPAMIKGVFRVPEDHFTGLLVASAR